MHIDQAITLWTSEHNTAAEREGWSIFVTGEYAIGRIGPDALFPNDDAAYHFVEAAAERGIPHAIAALKLHRQSIELRPTVKA